DALVRGDSGKLGELLDPTAKTVLSALTSSGEWEESTAKIEAVRVIRVSESGSGGEIAIAVQEPGAAYLLKWRASKAESGMVFAGVNAPANTFPRASDWDNANLNAPSAAPRPSTPSPDASEDESGPAPKEEAPKDEAPAQEDGDGGRVKRTPAGPVKIPGGGG
ncbi:MAG TPA: hypothetical protein VK176_15850, partial [Phycisphaerales bacterium]|nr:hypothetical protein [Phycisphaerales bacterium]